MTEAATRPGGAVLRWIAAGTVVLAAHAGGLWYALQIVPSHAAPGTPDAPILIDLAPVAAAPEAQPLDVAAGPQAMEAQPEPAPEQRKPEEPKPEEPKPEESKPEPSPEPVVERPIEMPPPPDIPPPEFKVADLPKKEEAQALIPPPPSRPPPPKKRPPPPPKKREVERRKPINPERPKSRQTSAPLALDAPRAEAAAAPSPGAMAAAAAARANWRAQLSAHLKRFTRFPPGAASTGTASVSYTLARSGAVVAASLARSSGDPVLDEAAVAIVRRASPFPAPPSDYTETLTFTQPIRFNR